MSEDLPQEQQANPTPPGVAGEMADPKEAQFNAMNHIAEASGPEAEARRQEMQRWSDATGAYAEAAAREHTKSVEYQKLRGATQEQVNAEIVAAAHRMAKHGANPSVYRYGEEHPDEEPTNITAHQNGMLSRPRPSVVDEQLGRFDRSPAHINGPAEPTKPEAQKIELDQAFENADSGL